MFCFFGGGKLLNWLHSSDKKDVVQNTTITETNSTPAKQSENKSTSEHEKSKTEDKTSTISIDSKTEEVNETESKPMVILGSTREETNKMFTDYQIDKEYEKNVDTNAVKFVNDNLLVVVAFDANGKAEGVSFLSSDTSCDGKNSYVNKHYDELLKLATGGKNVKVEKDGVSKYPFEVYIGNVHD